MKPRSRAIIVSTDTTISPFGDDVSETFFTHETLAETQARAFSALGLEVVRVASAAEARRALLAPGPHLLLLDRVFVSERAARSFVRAARRSPGAKALALAVNASVRYTLPLQDVRVDDGFVLHDVVWLEAADAQAVDEDDAVRFVHAMRDRATRLVIPNREIVAKVPMPSIGERGANTLEYPVTSTVVVSIENWVHILWLNQIAFGIRWLELVRRHPLWAVYRAATAFSRNLHRVLDRFVWRGSACDVHPTAYLSASILGRGVKVGAHATIRNSIVGDGAVISDHAVLLNSVVGPGAYIAENTFMVSTTCYPGASVGNYKLQVSLIGRDAYVSVWAGFVDAKFVGDVAVLHRGRLQASGRSFLGSVVGHRAQVSAKVLIQPGREIPNDTLVVMRPDEVVSVIPDDLPEGVPLVRDRGTLVRLGEESGTAA